MRTTGYRIARNTCGANTFTRIDAYRVMRIFRPRCKRSRTWSSLFVGAFVAPATVGKPTMWRWLSGQGHCRDNANSLALLSPTSLCRSSIPSTLIGISGCRVTLGGALPEADQEALRRWVQRYGPELEQWMRRHLNAQCDQNKGRFVVRS